MFIKFKSILELTKMIKKIKKSLAAFSDLPRRETGFPIKKYKFKASLSKISTSVSEVDSG
jgi:hypothetical protein